MSVATALHCKLYESCLIKTYYYYYFFFLIFHVLISSFLFDLSKLLFKNRKTTTQIFTNVTITCNEGLSNNSCSSPYIFLGHLLKGPCTVYRKTIKKTNKKFIQYAGLIDKCYRLCYFIKFCVV